MLAHVVVEVLDLVELDRAHGAHVGCRFLAARLGRHAHSCSADSSPGSTSSHRHGQSHYSGAGFRDGHLHRDGGGACRVGSGDPGDDPGNPGDDPGDTGRGAMQRHVPLQQGLVGELLLADVALVGLLTAVQAHVHIERALLREALVADAALIGTDARVGHHVLDQVILQGERAPADAALVWLLTCTGTETEKNKINERFTSHHLLLTVRRPRLWLCSFFPLLSVLQANIHGHRK